MKKERLFTSLMVAMLLATTNIVSATDKIIVEEGETLNIHEQTLENIESEFWGGAIENHGNLSIDNSTFSNNNALFGGALFNGSNINSINNSNFKNNTGVFGGAIVNWGSIDNENNITATIGSINNSTFEGNQAIGSTAPSMYIPCFGGAINSSYGLINEINNIVFVNNSAISDSSDPEIINDPNIFYNVYTNGGAIAGHIANITNSTFTSNFVKSYGNASSGALYLNSNYLTKYSEDNTPINSIKLPESNIIDSKFDGNFAEGLYATGGAITALGDVNITNTEFISNRAENAGGAIYLPGISELLYSEPDEEGHRNIEGIVASNATIKDSSFKYNTATNDKPLNIYENYYIDENETTADALYDTEPRGGAIYNGLGGQLKVDNTEFVHNSAIKINQEGSEYPQSGLGGAIHNSGGTLLVENSTFDANSAGRKGGAVNNESNGAASGNLTINNSKFYNNSVELKEGTSITGTEEKVYNFGYGGAISSVNETEDLQGNPIETNINNSEFTGNRVYIKYTHENRTDNEISKTEEAFGDGGAIYNIGNLNVSGSKFINNSAPYGGAIHNTGITNIKKNEFTNNSAYYTLTTDSTFTHNGEEYKTHETWNEGDGGALFTIGDIVIEDSTFSGNISADRGGALYAQNGNITIKNSTFTDNIAKSESNEGYYYVNPDGDVIHNDMSDIYGEGGAIAISPDFSEEKYKLLVENSTFENNIAGNFGGGAISTYFDTDINNSSFTGNNSTGNGGAIALIDGSLNITDSIFKNNSAQKGGAIIAETYSNNTPIVNITALNKDVIFSENKAEQGGDIYIADGTLNLNANEDKTISFSGGIVGKNSVININDSTKNLYENLSSTGKIVIDNFVSAEEGSNLAINHKAGTLALTKENYLDGTDLTLEEGSTLDLTNNAIGTMHLNSLKANNANLNVDADLSNSENTFDSISANTISGSLNLKNVNIISDFSDDQNELNITINPQEGFEIKLPENGLNAITKDYVYTIDNTDDNFSINRLTDESGQAIKTDGFTVAVNQTDKIGGVDVELSQERSFSASEDIKITGNNSGKGWTGNLGGKSLTVNGNGYTLDGEENTGITISDQQTLIFNDTNIKGFASTPDKNGALLVKDGGTLNINAINTDITLGEENSNIIYLDGTSSIANLKTENEKEITVNSNIVSANKSNNLKLSGNGKIRFNGIVDPLTLTNENTETIHNNYIDDVTYNLNAGMVTFAKDEYLNGPTNKNTLNFNGGTLNIANGSVGVIDLAAVSINANSNIMLDADLAAEKMDRITADSASAAKDAILNVSHINLLSDATKNTVEINAVDPTITLGENDTLANHIATSVKDVAYSNIYKYAVGYDPKTGNFTFSTGSSKDYNNINPSVMVSPVAAQLGGYMGMIDTYNNAFSNMDMRMLLPSSVRVAQKNANKYAITDTKGADFAVNETNSGGTWIRPFAAYDSVGLKNGPKVHNMSYGTFIGGDTAVHQFENGAEGVLSAHVSYLGSHQSFGGNSIYQNGGNLGLTGTLYKGNFFSGLSVNTGASVADASTMYGNEDFPMFMTGIANKTGYNIEFKEGKFIIQPSLLLSYTFVNTFNYTNASGVKIDGDPLHALQISPNVRFALNTKNGWQPYLTAGMNWNIMNSSEFMANAAELPSLSVKPYVQYGLGIQKTVNDNFTAYAQVLLRHGGRNGIAANAGMKYLFGHESRPKENI